MYLMTATLTEDLIGATISVEALEANGRRHKILTTETWLVQIPAGITPEQHAEVRRILDTEVSALSQKLRRVFPSVLPENG